MRSIPTRVGTTSPWASTPSPAPVHPHACGDYGDFEPEDLYELGPSPRVWGLLLWWTTGPWTIGPSPRVWGLPTGRTWPQVRGRSIPTRVGTTRPGRPMFCSCTVHPHACGDYSSAPITAEAPAGPSPRVWGLPARARPSRRHGRSIPTRVGTTRPMRVYGATCAVHPHACGDYHGPVRPRDALSGPSPRVWGLPGGLLPPGPLRRSIPTRVGTTASRPPRRGGGAVHPHACGDYLPLRKARQKTFGPSPRVWGLRRSGPRCPGPRRSIPTRVGTTQSGLHHRALLPVHPHACGDYWAALRAERDRRGPSPRVWGLRRPPGLSVWRAGPSPRVWGLRPRWRDLTRRKRSIPTRVGTTPAWPTPTARPSVHPHACGDYPVRRTKTGPHIGPSPRVWGLRNGSSFQAMHSRSIPTRVGTTGMKLDEFYTVAVHPHACGDYTPSPVHFPPSSGPSPRVWGLLPGGGGACSEVRSIPTRVGTTPRERLPERRGSVHPHACGDYMAASSTMTKPYGPSPRVWGLPSSTRPPWCKSGPSPRVWGLRGLVDLGPRDLRSIPTRVGTTAPPDW